MRAGYYDRYRTLLRFDLSQLPADAVIDQATLTLTCRKVNSGSYSLATFRVTGSWTESGVTWSNQPGHDPQTVGSIAPYDSTYRAYPVDATALVQGWTDGSYANQGIILESTGKASSSAYAQCYSSDYGTVSQRPRLEIQWHQPQAQPATRSYYYLGSQRVAMQVDDGGESKVYYIHTDHLGSTSAMSNESGTLVIGSVTRYLPYGGYRTAPSANLTDHGFTGHKHNSYIKLVDMKARWYSPQLGRFISPDSIVPDPSNPQSLNRYAYALGNPLKYVDPTGHFVKLPSLVDIVDTVKGRLSMWSPFAGGVVDEPRAPAPTSSDLTGWLVEQMVTNASEVASILRENYRSLNPVEVAAAYQAWTSLVRTGGAWDYKEDILKSEQTFGDEKLIMLGGREISYQAAANIHFGFVGRAATFESEFLQLGAGLAQIDDHGFVLENVLYYGDQAFDNWCIRFGVYLHDLHGGWHLDQLTPEAFSGALEDFITENGEPPDL